MEFYICKQIMKGIELVIRAEDFLLDPDVIKMGLDQACFESKWTI